MIDPDDAKNRFYQDLKDIISSVPKQNKLIILGDINTCVSREHASLGRCAGELGHWKVQ